MKRLKVFLSYSSEDNQFALRVYNDLKRSNINVWRYEQDSKKNTNFQTEYRSQLLASDFFCLIDSPDARASAHVTEEIGLALDHHAIKNRFAVCKITTGMDWRTANCSLNHHQITTLNNITYTDFSSLNNVEDTYDQHDLYLSNITTLLASMSTQYLPWSVNPWMEDVQKEFFAVVDTLQKVKKVLSLKDQEIILNDFRSAYHYWKKGDLSRAKERLQLLVRESEKLPTVTPELFLGMVCLDQCQYQEAYQLYEVVVKKKRNDPRGWFGIGLALFYLSKSSTDYQKALSSFEKSLSLTEEQTTNKHHQIARPRIISSIVFTLIELGQLQEAEIRLQSLDSFYNDLPEIEILHLFLLLEKKRFKDADYRFRQLLYLLRNPKQNTIQINFLLANLCVKFGIHKLLINNISEAIPYFEYATQLNPKDISFWAKLSQCYFAEKKHRELKQAITKGLQLNTFEYPSEHYYRGLLFYLKQDYEESMLFFKLSTTLKWPHYSKLFITK